MKPANEITRDGLISGVTPRVRPDRAIGAADADAFRAELDRRYQAPFIFKPWLPARQTNAAQPVLKWAKRILILILGGAMLAIGVAMIVLPGPAFIMIPAGLAVLAIEFAWARRWLRSARAILPLPHDGRPAKQKMTFKSVRRSLDFLFRQIRRTLLPK